MKALMKYAEFVRGNYTYIILSTLVIAVVVGLFTHAPGQFIRRFSVPLIVILIAAMSFTITFRNLGLATRNWKGTLAGVGLNFILAPFLCWLLASVFLSSHPGLATGLILIGVVPCAGMAMMWTGLLKGDVPLAIVIEALTTLLAPFVIPPLVSLLAGRFVTIDTLRMLKHLIYTVLFPVLGAVALREMLERLRVNAKKYLPLMPAVSATMAVLLMFMALNTAVLPIKRNLGLLVPVEVSTLVIFPVLFLAARLISTRWFAPGTSTAITYSSGMKNLPLAIGIAAMSFGGLETLPIAVAFAFQMITAVAFYQLFRKRVPRGALPEVEAEADDG